METEITVEVLETKISLNNKLVNLGFILKNSAKMLDYYFTSLTKNEIENSDYETLINHSFLIRTVTENENSESQIIFKNKKIENNIVLGETKIKTNINQPKEAIKIFLNAGLSNWCIVNNYTDVYVNKNIILCVQEIKNLGLFIEFEEYSEIKSLTSTEKLENLIQTLKSYKLNLGTDYNCKKPYMLLKNKKRK